MRSEEEWQRIEQENTELRQLVQDLQTMVKNQQEQIRTLTDRLNKNSRNSHLPPSSDRWARQPKSLRPKSERKAGGQPGHQGNTLMQTKHPDVIIEHPVSACDSCQQSLDDQPCLGQQMRQVIDLPIMRTQVIEHRIQSKQCPTCAHVSTSSFPSRVAAPVQFGPRYAALAVYLSQQHFLPDERTCEILHEICGLAPSVATLQTFKQRCATQLQAFETQLKAQLHRSAIMHQDETGLYVMGKRQWLHVSSTPTLTHYAVHAKRGCEAMDAIGILPGFVGVSVHDGWASYRQYDCDHALCNVHHLRELTGIHEQFEQPWAKELKDLLLEMKMAAHSAKDRGLAHVPKTERDAFHRRYQRLLAQGFQVSPPAESEPGKRGRVKQHPARNLLDRLAVVEHVLAFLDNVCIPFDNSLAERDVRMMKVQQKVSGGFRSIAGAQAFCRIRSYLSTLAKQGFHLLTALEMACTGHPILSCF